MESVSIDASRAGRADAELIAYGGLTLTSLLWASAFIAGKVVLAEMTPLPAAAWRYAIAATVLLPFAARRRPATEISRVDAVGPLAVMVLAGGVLYPWLFLTALSKTTATNTALLVALNPVFTVLLAPLIGERLTRNRLAGGALALTGAVTVITKGDLRHLTALTFNTGDLLAVAAAATWATFNLSSRRVVSRLTPAFTNCVIFGIGSIALYALGRGEQPWAQLLAATPAALGGILVMAILSSVLAGQMFLVGVRTLGVSRTVVFVYLVPVLTAVLSTLFLGERFDLSQGAGGAAVLAGVYWSTRTRGVPR